MCGICWSFLFGLRFWKSLDRPSCCFIFPLAFLSCLWRQALLGPVLAWDLPVGAQFALTVVEQTQVDVAPTFSQSPRPTLGSPSSQG